MVLLHGGAVRPAVAQAGLACCAAATQRQGRVRSCTAAAAVSNIAACCCAACCPVLQVQLATFAVSLAAWPARICYNRRWRGFAALAVRGCRTLHAAMLATPAVLLGQPLGADGGAAAPPEVCATSVSSMMVMALFCHIVLLILVPCGATYAVEYALKAQCLRSKGLRLRPPWAWPRGAALLLVAAAAHVALLGAWVLSELVVRGLQPRRWQCDPETEWLVRLPAGVGAT